MKNKKKAATNFGGINYCHLWPLCAWCLPFVETKRWEAENPREQREEPLQWWLVPWPSGCGLCSAMDVGWGCGQLFRIGSKSRFLLVDGSIFGFVLIVGSNSTMELKILISTYVANVLAARTSIVDVHATKPIDWAFFGGKLLLSTIFSLRGTQGPSSSNFTWMHLKN